MIRINATKKLRANLYQSKYQAPLANLVVKRKRPSSTTICQLFLPECLEPAKYSARKLSSWNYWKSPFTKIPKKQKLTSQILQAHPNWPKWRIFNLRRETYCCETYPSHSNPASNQEYMKTYIAGWKKYDAKLLEFCWSILNSGFFRSSLNTIFETQIN